MSAPTISLLIPVLRRPNAAALLWENVRECATVPTEIVFVCSPNDRNQRKACNAIAERDPLVRVLVAPWRPDRGDYARKINHAYRETEAPYVFTGADDIRFTARWDELTLRAAAAPGAGVIGTDDACNSRTRGARRHSTHSLVARAYIDTHGGTVDATPGVVMHEGYWHNFCDDELVMVARYRGAYHPSAAVVQHLHPMRKTAPMDATYEKGQREFARDRSEFSRRMTGIGRRFR